MNTDWRSDLEVWLAPFLAALGHKAQRAMCPAYIAGLIGPGDRKSLQPMVARNGDIPYDRLHHFVSAGVWDSAPLEVVLWRHADHLVGGKRSWLIGEHRSTGERKYYLSNLPADTSLRLLASAIKARWVCEQAHQQLKEELGLDHFEGRSWTGPPPQLSLPAIRQAILDRILRPPIGQCPHCGNLLCQTLKRILPK